MLKPIQEQQYSKDIFQEVDKKFWQVVEKERLLFEINNKINNKKEKERKCYSEEKIKI